MFDEVREKVGLSDWMVCRERGAGVPGKSIFGAGGDAGVHTSRCSTLGEE